MRGTAASGRKRDGSTIINWTSRKLAFLIADPSTPDWVIALIQDLLRRDLLTLPRA